MNVPMRPRVSRRIGSSILAATSIANPRPGPVWANHWWKRYIVDLGMSGSTGGIRAMAATLAGGGRAAPPSSPGQIALRGGPQREPPRHGGGATGRRRRRRGTVRALRRRARPRSPGPRLGRADADVADAHAAGDAAAVGLEGDVDVGRGGRRVDRRVGGGR